MAAKREFYEETGLTATRLVLLATLNLAREKEQQKNYFLSVYHAAGLSGAERAGDDAVSLHWLCVAQMQHRRVIPTVREMARKLEEDIHVRNCIH